MSKIQGITHEGLRDAIIAMQVGDEKFAYFGFFGLYFNFVEDFKLPAAAGVAMINSKLTFVYNPKRINPHVEKYGEKFLTFLIIHECQHILLNHILRTEERNHKISNIAQDMLINSWIDKDFGFSYDDFYYVERDYENLKYEGSKYKGAKIFEALYEVIIENCPDSERQEDGDGMPGDGQGSGGGGGSQNDQDDSENDNGDGQAAGSGSGEGEDYSVSSPGKGKGKLVDDHELTQKYMEKMSDADKSKMDALVAEIHDTIKARGFNPSEGIEKMFNLKKQKPIVNVFKKVFGSGKLKSGTYRKLSRRNPKLKGKRKENKDVTIIMDSSGSLWEELNEIMPQVVGNFNTFLVQIDTEVKFAGHIKSFKDWAGVPCRGGGGTTLQAGIDRVIKEGREDVQIIFVSDFYCERLDFDGIKGEVCFVKTKNSTDPDFINCRKHKTIESHR